jgi:hypothetical protein
VLHEGDRRDVFRLDVGFDSMQLHAGEGVPQHQLQARRHVALPGIGLLGVVAHVRALEEAADNLVQHEDADDRAILYTADQEALDPRLLQALHPVGEGRGIGRRRHPAAMQPTTRLIPPDHFSLVPPGWLAQVDAFSDLESVFEIRLRHVEPSFAKPR